MGNCAIVSAWESKEALDGSEQAIASIRSETVDAVAGQLNSIELAEVLREVRVSPSQVGSRTRVGAVSPSGWQRRQARRLLRNGGLSPASSPKPGSSTVG